MQRLPTFLLLGVLVLVWCRAGLNNHVLMKTCYESRHSIDKEPMVAPGLPGVVMDLVFWPLFALGNLAEPPDCLPRPLRS